MACLNCFRRSAPTSSAKVASAMVAAAGKARCNKEGLCMCRYVCVSVFVCWCACVCCVSIRVYVRGVGDAEGKWAPTVTPPRAVRGRTCGAGGERGGRVMGGSFAPILFTQIVCPKSGPKSLRTVPFYNSIENTRRGHLFFLHHFFSIIFFRPECFHNARSTACW